VKAMPNAWKISSFVITQRVMFAISLSAKACASLAVHAVAGIGRGHGFAAGEVAGGVVVGRAVVGGGGIFFSS
jgi:hypothetical protein